MTTERYYKEFYKFKIVPPRPRRYSSPYEWGVFSSVYDRLREHFKQYTNTKRERYKRREHFKKEAFK